MADVKSVINDFHDHLDECRQCRLSPMNLCVIGGILLSRVGTIEGYKSIV